MRAAFGRAVHRPRRLVQTETGRSVNLNALSSQVAARDGDPLQQCNRLDCGQRENRGQSSLLLEAGSWKLGAGRGNQTSRVLRFEIARGKSLAVINYMLIVN